MKQLILCMTLFLSQYLWSDEPVTLSAYWNGLYFYEHNEPNIRHACIIKGTSILFNVGHLYCYGHALLDGVIPLYTFLTKYSLLDKPFNLLISATDYEQQSLAFKNIVQLIKDIFEKCTIIISDKDAIQKNIYYIESLIFNEHVPCATPNKFLDNSQYAPFIHPHLSNFSPSSVPFAPHFSFYKAVPESTKYMKYLQGFGICDNIIFQDTHHDTNLVKEFVNFVKQAYSINLPMIKNRLTIAVRQGFREILNIQELVSSFQSKGFDVHLVSFEKLSIKDQIIETMQSEYLIGIYGSNLTNALFLSPNANAVVIWHKYLKYFYSRKYCVIHSAFLSAGVRLVEYDKPHYDPRDQYASSTSSLHDPIYFMRVGSTIQLKPEKESLQEILQCSKLPHDIFETNLYIDPEDIIHCLDAISENKLNFK